MIGVKELSAYNMSSQRGFLCGYEAGEIVVPGLWAEAANLAHRLPDMLPSGAIRSVLETRLPPAPLLPSLADLTNAQLRKLFVHYSFMVQAYIWGERTPANVLPEAIAVPMVAIADALGQHPLLTYSAYVLDNWALIEPQNGVDLDNIYMIQNFLSGQDEAWFVLVHVAIEAKAGAVLAKMAPIIGAVEQQNEAQICNLLEACAASWEQINQIFERMPESCDPYIYFERVRPYIHGWANNPALPNGIVYTGVAKYKGQGQTFRGQTGSQSSIVPSMDALLGIGHAADPLKTYLDELHAYRPAGHRHFINDVRRSSRLRDFVAKADWAPLTDAYNANVQLVADFRSRHLEYAATYINKQGHRLAGNDTKIGTGGTPFMRYLKKHRDETRANRL